jgi:Icc-related predicted phosphoesterase
VLSLVPGLLLNKLNVGRYLDVFIAHAPPWQVHDEEDLPHRGIKAFRWLIKVFQPAYFLHGHIHIYRRETVTRTLLDKTTVQNVYGYKVLTLPTPQVRSWQRKR